MVVQIYRIVKILKIGTNDDIQYSRILRCINHKPPGLSLLGVFCVYRRCIQTSALITYDLNRSGLDMLCDVYTRLFWTKPEGWNHLENLNVYGIVVLKLIFKKCYGGGTCNGLLSQG